MNVHSTTIAFLKRKQKVLREKGLKWEQKLLDDVAGKDAELEGAKERRDETKAKLFALQERWQRDLEEERRRQEERKRIEENKRAKQLLAIREKKAVAKIERWYKGILIARAKAGAGKKKKKDKKKKKKKAK